MSFTALDALLEKYPKLRAVLLGGHLTKKVTRLILGLEKWEVDVLHAELIAEGYITISSNGTFRATPEVTIYVCEKKQEG